MRYVARRAIILALVSIGLTAVPPAEAASSDVDAARQATAKYQDVKAALADGYVPAPSGCISAKAEGLPPEWGAMGVHYINPGLLKLTGDKPRVNGMSTHTDFSKPSILLYEPQANGSLELIAIENLVFQAAWKSAGNSQPPAFGGKTWDTMADDPATAADEAHQFAPHYDLHIWTLRKNPSGMMVPFNPKVTCEFFKG